MPTGAFALSYLKPIGVGGNAARTDPRANRGTGKGRVGLLRFSLDRPDEFQPLVSRQLQFAFLRFAEPFFDLSSEISD